MELEDYKKRQAERWEREKALATHNSPVSTPEAVPVRYQPASSRAYEPLPNPWSSNVQIPVSNNNRTGSDQSPFLSPAGTRQVADLGYTRIEVSSDEMDRAPCRTVTFILWYGV